MSIKSDFDVVVRFTTSREIPPDLKEVRLGSYKIRSIPSVRSLLTPRPDEALLEFLDFWQEGQMVSNPETEAHYILALLSVLGRTIISFDSVKVNNVNVTYETSRAFKQFIGKLDLPSDFQDIYQSLFSLDEKVFSQYIRSCTTYRNAISVIHENPTLGCFLLVVAVECLSNTVAKGEGVFEKFCNFIIDYLPPEIQNEETDKELLVELLSQIYKDYRSGFTHGGRPISSASWGLAERVKMKYIKVIEEGREVKKPSLTWFENIVRGVLIHYLRKAWKGNKVEENRSRLVQLAVSEGVVVMKLKKSKRAGEFVFSGDVEVK